jgi:hypothetical protein
MSKKAGAMPKLRKFHLRHSRTSLNYCNLSIPNTLQPSAWLKKAQPSVAMMTACDNLALPLAIAFFNFTTNYRSTYRILYIKKLYILFSQNQGLSA